MNYLLFNLFDIVHELRQLYKINEIEYDEMTKIFNYKDLPIACINGDITEVFEVYNKYKRLWYHHYDYIQDPIIEERIRRQQKYSITKMIECIDKLITEIEEEDNADHNTTFLE